MAVLHRLPHPGAAFFARVSSVSQVSEEMIERHLLRVAS